MRIYPTKTSQYPLYIFVYWVLIWAVVFLYSTFTIFASLTPDGKFVQKTECVSKDKNDSCTKYSKPYYVPLNTELKYTFVQQGIIVGILSIGIGTALMLKSKYSKRS